MLLCYSFSRLKATYIIHVHRSLFSIFLIHYYANVLFVTCRQPVLCGVETQVAWCVIYRLLMSHTSVHSGEITLTVLYRKLSELSSLQVSIPTVLEMLTSLKISLNQFLSTGIFYLHLTLRSGIYKTGVVFSRYSHDCRDNSSGTLIM